jgi:hypothetical protein
LGVLHDFQAVALAFKTDNAEAKQEIKQRVWDALQGGLMNKVTGNGGVGTTSSGRAKKGSGNSSNHRNSRRDGGDAEGDGGDHNGANKEDEEWAYAAFKTLRVSMMSEKLLPPGEVFVVETEKVLRRDAFVDQHSDGEESASCDNEYDSDDEGAVNDKIRRNQDKTGRKGKGIGKDQKTTTKKRNKSYRYVGRPARRIVLKYVRDVETRFREVRFGSTMLTDHNPAKYEDALDGLRFGIVEDEES